MPEAQFYVHGELNDFLPREQRQTAIELTFGERQSVKHLFESLGVPHTEVGGVRANGRPVDFGYLVQEGDRIDVLPFSPAELYLPARDGKTGFVLDMHLGKLARYLRILGFDALYRNDFSDEALAEIAATGERILLTRDRRLLMRKQVRHGYCVRSLDPNRQAVEVIERYHLNGQIEPFKRCPHCNTPLEPVSKDAVLERLEPLTRRYFDEFHQCPGCGQVYWKGSHFARLEEFIERFQI